MRIEILQTDSESLRVRCASDILDSPPPEVGEPDIRAIMAGHICSQYYSFDNHGDNIAGGVYASHAVDSARSVLATKLC